MRAKVRESKSGKNGPAGVTQFSAMARRRRKQRTHIRQNAPGGDSQSGAKSDVPRSFIIKHGQVGAPLTQLVRDMRRVMEPNTASRLKVCILEQRLNIDKCLCIGTNA